MANITKITKMCILDLIMYSSVIGIIIWVVLKSIGIIHTLTFIELLPMLFGAVGFFALIVKLGNVFGVLQFSVNRLGRDVSAIKARQDETATAIVKVETDLGYIKKDLTKHSSCKNFKPSAN